MSFVTISVVPNDDIESTQVQSVSKKNRMDTDISRVGARQIGWY